MLCASFGGAGSDFQKWGRRCKPRRRRLVCFVAEARRRVKGLSTVVSGVKILGFVVVCGVLKCWGRMIGVTVGGVVGRLSSVSRRFSVCAWHHCEKLDWKVLGSGCWWKAAVF